jgi:hypothetical protein
MHASLLAAVVWARRPAICCAQRLLPCTAASHCSAHTQPHRSMHSAGRAPSRCHFALPPRAGRTGASCNASSLQRGQHLCLTCPRRTFCYRSPTSSPRSRVCTKRAGRHHTQNRTEGGPHSMPHSSHHARAVPCRRRRRTGALPSSPGRAPSRQRRLPLGQPLRPPAP